MQIEIGLQLFSVKNEIKKDYPKALEKVAAIGYQNIELLTRLTEDGLRFGESLPASEQRRLQDQLGLKAVSCHVMPLPGLDWDSASDACLETGSHTIVAPVALFSSKAELLAICAGFNRAGEICQKKGLQFYYHNHFQEFQTFEGQLAMDIMLKNLDPGLVKFELDTYWAVRGGQDPLAWINKLGKRCDLLHQKDLPAGVQPLNLVEYMAQNPGMAFFDVVKVIRPDHFTEIGRGLLPIAAILEAGSRCGEARYVFVEQDMSSLGEMESIAISLHYLESLLKVP